MINGTVVGLQAQISVVLCLAEIPNIEIKFVVDTGMIGFLTLPSAAIAKLGLTYLTQINANESE